MSSMNQLYNINYYMYNRCAKSVTQGRDKQPALLLTPYYNVPTYVMYQFQCTNVPQ